VETWWLVNEEDINLRSENDWTIDLQPHTVCPKKYFNNFIPDIHSDLLSKTYVLNNRVSPRDPTIREVN